MLQPQWFSIFFFSFCDTLTSCDVNSGFWETSKFLGQRSVVTMPTEKEGQFVTTNNCPKYRVTQSEEFFNDFQLLWSIFTGHNYRPFMAQQMRHRAPVENSCDRSWDRARLHQTKFLLLVPKLYFITYHCESFLLLLMQSQMERSM